MQDALEEQLAEVQKNCSATPPPPTCESAIAKLQAKIMEEVRMK